MSKFIPIFALFIVGLGAYNANAAATFQVREIFNRGVFQPAVLNSKKPVVVYYYSEDTKKCNPCEWVQPQLERVMKRKADLVRYATVNLDVVPEFMEEHGLQKLPTVATFINGEMVDEVEGAQWGKIVNLVNRAAKMSLQPVQ